MKGKAKTLLLITSIVLFIALVTTIILGEIRFDSYNTYGNKINGQAARLSIPARQ